MRSKHILLLSCSLLSFGFSATTFASRHDGDSVSFSVNLNDGRARISLPVEEDRHYGRDHFRGVQPKWVDMQTGDPLPANAVVGGEQYNPNALLYVCRGAYRGGVHPGKLIGGNCNISYGGNEVILSRYEVLVSRAPLDWVRSFGNIPGNAVRGGYEHGNTLYICQTKYRNGVHPGKVVGQSCNIGWGGQEIINSNFRVLVQ